MKEIGTILKMSRSPLLSHYILSVEVALSNLLFGMLSVWHFVSKTIIPLHASLMLLALFCMFFFFRYFEVMFAISLCEIIISKCILCLFMMQGHF